MDRFDLNLLLALEAMLRERSVSKAAARLGVGQPAMSAALNRLRDLFDDPMFVRTAGGMQPTPRALETAAPLGEALDRLRRLVEPPQPFHPSSARRTFRVSGGDYIAMVLAPALIAALQRAAPGVDLRFRFVEKDQLFERMDSGEIDLALAVMGEPPQRFRAEPVLMDTFVCLARVGHPLEGEPLTVEAFARQRHALVTERGDEVGALDALLAAQGLTRRVAVTIPQVSLLPAILQDTDLIATVGRRAAEKLSQTHRLTIHPLPLDAEPWTMSIIWPARTHHDPGLAWLRQLIDTLCRETA
jgi:DNA-binding transcriptional LysR family regulator